MTGLSITSFVENDEDELFGFIKCHNLEFYQYIQMAAAKFLERRDFAVLFVLVWRMDSRSGRIKITVNFIAEQLGVKASDVSASITRLKKCRLVCSIYNSSTGEKFFLVNPAVFSVGGKNKRVALLKTFNKALEG